MTPVVRHGWTILPYTLFLDQIERLAEAAAKERRGAPGAPPGSNAKLLGHLLDLAFDKIPRDPGGPQFRRGGELGGHLKHWFRGKTGNGRHRLFYRFSSSAKVIVLAWVNDERTLRTYGSDTDAYKVFAGMIADADPPDDWDALAKAASAPERAERFAEAARRYQSARDAGEAPHAG